MISDNEVMVRLFLSMLLGGLIGLERQAHRRSAGLRTHIMVSLGSCLIMLTSIYVFDIYMTKANVDPGRIAAGVITGIGFLGAGAILREREGVKGLTTAASLWVVAAIGLATGCGFLVASLFTTALSLIVLLILRYLEQKIID
ncbi:MAG: MgtC/SapB family protein [Candidatus Omnitrophota bacterium]|jgi:putative Mg2+ transporter-C (MgtC) family protein|nr:MAG: MgtC/SapB family protein [Candidatus Omnitrophota bacterium]